MSETLIKVEEVSKKFCRSLKKSLWYGMQDIGREITGRQHCGDAKLRPDEFWAIKDVSFELKRGECLGLLGHNGAGKTTLLKMLNGLIKPDSGIIEVKGKTAAIIALGAGFNPVLTGRENVFANASILGLSNSEVNNKIQDIIDFAEIHDFIDSPIQIYSSGMQVRLGFAIATALEVDILILDEILAVGDANFRLKCYNKIAEIRDKSSIIFVSHNMEQVGRMCNKCLLLNKGSIDFAGDTSQAITLYESLNASGNNQDASFNRFAHPISAFQTEVESKEIATGDPIELKIQISSKEKTADTIIKTIFYTATNEWAAESVFLARDYDYSLPADKISLSLKIDSVTLKAGEYLIGIILIGANGKFLGWSYKNHKIKIKSKFNGHNSNCILKTTLNDSYDEHQNKN